MHKLNQSEKKLEETMYPGSKRIKIISPTDNRKDTIMTAYINFFPLGNADSVRLDLTDGRKVLIDYAAMLSEDEDDKRCDLPTILKSDLDKNKRDYFDAVCITHTDSDHCKGFGDFFWLKHAKKYQADDRVKINELWVPAAAILEEGLTGDARLVRSEARHRLIEGEGIRIFSHPDALVEWIKNEDLDFEQLKHLIVDAGTLVPGYSLDGPEKVEFFVHCPFGWRQDQGKFINRNEDSIVMQATFLEGERKTRLLLASDIDHETVADIVNITRDHGNDSRLQWDIMKLMHHCSYLSLGPDRGKDETKPIEEVRWLFEDQRQTRSAIISPSWEIPEKNSIEDKSDQPPHRQAANYHRRITDVRDGEFKVTMEHPSKTNPKPFTYKVSKFGIALASALLAVPGIKSTVASSNPRAG